MVGNDGTSESVPLSSPLTKLVALFFSYCRTPKLEARKATAAAAIMWIRFTSVFV